MWVLCGVAAQQSAASTAQPSYDARSEYFTKEEMAELFKPKKKKVYICPFSWCMYMLQMTCGSSDDAFP